MKRRRIKLCCHKSGTTLTASSPMMMKTMTMTTSKLPQRAFLLPEPPVSGFHIPESIPLPPSVALVGPGEEEEEEEEELLQQQEQQHQQALQEQEEQGRRHCEREGEEEGW